MKFNNTWLTATAASRNGIQLSAEAKALFLRMSTQPSSARKVLIDSTIIALKNAGYWDRLDVLQVYAAHAENDSLLNWKGNSINASKISTPTFEVDRGFTSSNGKGIDTGFNPVVSGSNFKVDDYSFGVYSRTDSQSNNRDAGHADLTTGSVVRARNTSDQVSYLTYRSNLTLTNSGIVSPTSKGLFTVDKSAATTGKAYYNGVQKVTDSTSSGSFVNNNMYVGFYNNNGTPEASALRQYSYYYAGDSLSESDLQSFFAIMESYLLNIGAGFFLT